jgi:hypothetical protein
VDRNADTRVKREGETAGSRGSTHTAAQPVQSQTHSSTNRYGTNNNRPARPSERKPLTEEERQQRIKEYVFSASPHFCKVTIC